MNATHEPHSRPIRRRPALRPALVTVAREELGIEGGHLVPGGFHHLSAMSLRRALEAAYAAGLEAQRAATLPSVWLVA